MADDLRRLDEEFRSKIKNMFNKVVDSIQKSVAQAKSLDVDKAEKLLDDSCDQFQSKMTATIEAIKFDVKKNET
jgi:hypothetical protein